MILQCTHCGKDIERRQHVDRLFCTRDCWRQQLLKERDITGYNILKHVNTPNFCYLIGLICTDGHINIRKGVKDNNGNTCKIQLKLKEFYILEQIQRLFGGHIFNKSKRNIIYPIWQISNKKFNEYLINCVGITQNKTFTLDTNKWFWALTEDNKYHYLRGVIDGDGCVSVSFNSRGFPDYKVSITSASPKFLEMIQTFIGVGSIIRLQSKASNLVICAKKAVEKLNKCFNINYKLHIHHKDKYTKFKIIEKHVRRNLDGTI